MTVPLSTRRAMHKRAVQKHDREMAAYRAELADAERIRLAERLAAIQARKDADTKLQAAIQWDGIEVGDLVRDRFDWYPVVKVNAKSVVVDLGGPYTERIAKSKIIETRKP